jgi:hypothetical protein
MTQWRICCLYALLMISVLAPFAIADGGQRALAVSPSPDVRCGAERR